MPGRILNEEVQCPNCGERLPFNYQGKKDGRGCKVAESECNACRKRFKICCGTATPLSDHPIRCRKCKARVVIKDLLGGSCMYECLKCGHREYKYGYFCPYGCKNKYGGDIIASGKEALKGHFENHHTKEQLVHCMVEGIRAEFKMHPEWKEV